MLVWQKILSLFTIFNLLLFVKSYKECKNKNSYGLTKPLFLLGMYVWGDVFVFSIFWAVVSIASVLIGNLYLFCLIVSLFWVIRSFGETIYWFNQQFSAVEREPAKKVEFYSIMQNNSVWFIQQIKNQCITVIALVAAIYFTNLWLHS
jgi:hypothetical protein